MSVCSKLLITDQDILIGKHIQLEPITNQHRDALQHAADDERIWHYMPHKAMYEQFDPWFDDCVHKMSTGEQITYVVRRKTDRVVVGATAYYDVHLDNKRLTLGYSWFNPEVWGTVVNPESKFLMLTQAFETWGVNRVELGADSRNLHSLQAIKKLGAKEEGVLRQHMVLHGDEVTDTVVFSILATEWPIVKTKLKNRI